MRMNIEKEVSKAPTVLVYLYTYWDDRTHKQETSTRFATLEAIRNGLGLPVLENARKVDRAGLIEGAFYVPSPAEFLEHNPMATSKDTV